jgi:hypothetical protein
MIITMTVSPRVGANRCYRSTDGSPDKGRRGVQLIF